MKNTPWENSGGMPWIFRILLWPVAIVVYIQELFTKKKSK